MNRFFFSILRKEYFILLFLCQNILLVITTVFERKQILDLRDRFWIDLIIYIPKETGLDDELKIPPDFREEQSP
jgi:hypothetical protein